MNNHTVTLQQNGNGDYDVIDTSNHFIWFGGTLSECEKFLKMSEYLTLV